MKITRTINMNKRYLSVLLLFSSANLFGQAFQTLWAASVGWYNQDNATELALDGEGNLWGIGYSDGQIDSLPYAGKEDVFLFKMDSDGAVIWQTTLGGIHEDRGYNLAIDAHNNCWISGYFKDTFHLGGSSLTAVGQTDAFLAKYASNGSLLWKQNLGSTGFEMGHNLLVSGAFVYWTGIFQDIILVGPDTLREATNIDIFLIKLDTAGNYIWAKQWGCPTTESLAGITVDPFDNVTVSSLFRDAVVLDGDTTFGNSHSNIFVAQFAPNGTLRWSNSMGGTSNSLCNDEAGNLYLAGSYQYPIVINGQALNPWAEFDAFVVSLDSSGQFRWTQTLVGPDQIISSALLWNAQRQELYVSGILQGTIYFGNDSLERSSSGLRHLDNDIFIISFDRQGLPLYSQKFGGTDGDWVASLVWDSLGGSLYMYGTYSTITNIGGSILNAFGGAEIFVAKLNIQPLATQPIQTLPIHALQVSPNPFYSSATFRFSMDEPMDLTIQVLDIQGRLVEMLWDGYLAEGEQQLVLDAKYYNNNNLYFIHLQSKNRQQYFKFVVSK